VQEVAKTLDIHPMMLSRWRKEYREGRFVVKKVKTTAVKAASSELNRLKNLEVENECLKQENDLLKKWQRFLVEQHQSDIDLSRNTPEA